MPTPPAEKVPGAATSQPPEMPTKTARTTQARLRSSDENVGKRPTKTSDACQRLETSGPSSDENVGRARDRDAGVAVRPRWRTAAGARQVARGGGTGPVSVASRRRTAGTRPAPAESRGRLDGYAGCTRRPGRQSREVHGLYGAGHAGRSTGTPAVPGKSGGTVDRYRAVPAPRTACTRRVSALIAPVQPLYRASRAWHRPVYDLYTPSHATDSTGTAPVPADSRGAPGESGRAPGGAGRVHRESRRVPDRSPRARDA